MPNEQYRIRVDKDSLVFCAGHFITYNGDECERLHGHNYRVAVEVTGPLDENQYVFDFIALKNETQAITDELDHRMLLPTKNRLIVVEERPPSVHVMYNDRAWMFPLEDCILLPIENTTAELLGRWIGGRLLAVLQDKHGFAAKSLAVEVEESFGQSARVELDHTLRQDPR